mmetsp:Transcript_3958/g.11377  ORF Transcript_3958/g.11377 Transcript_3958/m.11377 type:complete len:237 (-) Transcript_3958:225-935(-)
MQKFVVSGPNPIKALVYFSSGMSLYRSCFMPKQASMNLQYSSMGPTRYTAWSIRRVSSLAQSPPPIALVVRFACLVARDWVCTRTRVAILPVIPRIKALIPGRRKIAYFIIPNGFSPTNTKNDDIIDESSSSSACRRQDFRNRACYRLQAPVWQCATRHPHSPARPSSRPAAPERKGGTTRKRGPGGSDACDRIPRRAGLVHGTDHDISPEADADGVHAAHDRPHRDDVESGAVPG